MRRARVRPLVPWILLAPILLSTATCAPNRMWNPQRVVLHDENLRLELHTIEFDDQGELWDDRQLATCLNAIHDAPNGRSDGSPTGPLNVVVFVHGWTHDARESDDNVQAFREVLVRRARAECRIAEIHGLKPEPIIGVFLGWRGRSLSFPFLWRFSFFSRRAAASRVGGLSATETLLSIASQVSARPDDSHTIIVGHSLGALVVERALAQAFLGVLLSSPAEAPVCTPAPAPSKRPIDVLVPTGRERLYSATSGESEWPSVRSPFDLVVLVNSAAPALTAKQLIDALYRRRVMTHRIREDGSADLDGRLPVLVSVTSEGDAITRRALPLSQALTAATKKFREKESWPLPPIEFLPTSSIPPPQETKRPVSQRDLVTRTAANTPKLWSHEVRPLPPGASEEGQDVTFSAFVNGVRRRYGIRRFSGGWNQSDYWIFQVPREIVPDHSRIFREPFEELLVALLERATIYFDPATGKFKRFSRTIIRFGPVTATRARAES